MFPCCCYISDFFFFQAEDGIRDADVTGVQTCALPIWIRNAEPVSGLLDDHLKTDTLASAKRILTDNGLKIVSAAAGVTGLWEPNPNFSQNLDLFKKRCAQFAELGAPLVYSPCATAAKFAA